MGKRGQFFIILAIIISIALFSLSISENKYQEAVLFEDFNELSYNYVHEAPKVVNYAIYNDQVIKDILNTYTFEFLNFAQLRNPSLELIYIYNNGTKFFVKSYAKETILVETEQETLEVLGAQEETINNINLNVAGINFTQQVPLQLKNFGDEFSTADFSTLNNTILNLGGVFHNFDLSTEGPELDVIVRSRSNENIQIYSTGSSQEFPIKI